MGESLTCENRACEESETCGGVAVVNGSGSAFSCPVENDSCLEGNGCVCVDRRADIIIVHCIAIALSPGPHVHQIESLGRRLCGAWGGGCVEPGGRLCGGCVEPGEEAVWNLGRRLCGAWGGGCVEPGEEAVWSLGRRLCGTWGGGCVEPGEEAVWSLGRRLCGVASFTGSTQPPPQAPHSLLPRFHTASSLQYSDSNDKSAPTVSCNSKGLRV